VSNEKRNARAVGADAKQASFGSVSWIRRHGYLARPVRLSPIKRKVSHRSPARAGMTRHYPVLPLLAFDRLLALVMSLANAVPQQVSTAIFALLKMLSRGRMSPTNLSGGRIPAREMSN